MVATYADALVTYADPNITYIGGNATDRFWVRNISGSTGLWSDPQNWSSISGGPGGAAVPIAGDNIFFDGNGISGVEIDVPVLGLSITSTAAYTGAGANDGHLDNATNDQTFTITGDVTLANKEVSLGDVILTWGGNVDLSGVTTGNANASTLIMTGTGVTLNQGGFGGFDLFNFTPQTGATISQTESGDVGGLLLANGELSLVSGKTIRTFLDVKVAATGSITGPGAFSLQPFVSISQQDGTFDIDLLSIANDHTTSTGGIVAATYGCAEVEIINSAGTNKNFEWQVGTYTFTGNVTFKTTGAGTYHINNALNDATINIDGSLTTSQVGAITLSMGDVTWTLKDDIDLTGVTTFNKDGSSVILGAGDLTTHLIDFNGFSIGSLAVDANAADKKQFQSNFTCASYTGTLGEVIDNGKTITVNGNILIANTANLLTSTGQWDSPLNFVNISNPNATNRIALFVPDGGFIQTGNFYVTDVFMDFQGGSKTYRQSSFTMFVGGDFVMELGAGIFLGDTGTIEFDATGGTHNVDVANATFNNVIVNNAGVTSFSTSQDMDINGSLTLSTGKFDQNGKTIDIAKSFTNSIGANFVHNNGTIQLSSANAATITGTTTFGTLKIDITSAKTITWDNTATFTFANDVTIKTTTGNTITLVSDSPGTQYSWDVQGTQDLLRVNATDCDASSGLKVHPHDSVFEGQNTINWGLPVAAKGFGLEVKPPPTPPLLKGFGLEVKPPPTPPLLKGFGIEVGLEVPTVGRRGLTPRRSIIILNAAR